VRLAGVIYSLVALLMAAPFASAQSTRAETIAKEQAEKAKKLASEGPGEAELVIRRLLLSPLLSGGDGLYPWFGSVFGGSGMSIGAGFLKRLEKAAYFNVQSGISINASTMMRGTVGAPELWRGMLLVEASAEWIDAKDVAFYGFGQQSAAAARESYTYSPKEVGGNVTVRPMRFVSVSGSYLNRHIGTQRDASVFSQEEAPGLDQDLTFDSPRATVAFDWRTSPGYSTRGGYYRASYERNHARQGLRYSFDLQEYEVVQLMPLVREQFVLAFRGLTTLTSADEGHEVPVMLAPFLGSGSTLRSYRTRRFTDRNRLLLTGEYRWRPSRYLDMALFVDAGQVAADRREFTTSAFDVSWGIGARIHGPAFNAVRVEVARGREGFHLIFSGSQPF
jgi:hypothetical protein